MLAGGQQFDIDRWLIPSSARRIAWLTRTQRAFTSATARCGSGEAPSDAVPGRLLPLYELRLYPAG
jgi:hypothetical protein